jgi:hypothetical protein
MFCEARKPDACNMQQMKDEPRKWMTVHPGSTEKHHKMPIGNETLINALYTAYSEWTREAHAISPKHRISPDVVGFESLPRNRHFPKVEANGVLAFGISPLPVT